MVGPALLPARTALNAVSMPAVPISTSAPAVAEDVGQPLRRLVLLVAKLGVGVNPVGRLDQLAGPPIDGLAHALLQCIKVWHRPALVGRPACA